MKKYFVILLLIIITPIMSFFVINKPSYTYVQTLADSGFDSDYSDYDSGWDSDYGGGSGGYWDDDDDNYYDRDDNYQYESYSGGPADIGTVLLALAVCAAFGSIPLLISFAISRARKPRTRKIPTHIHIKNVLANYYGLKAGDGSNIDLIKNIYAIYVEIQKAWMNRDLTPVRHLLTDEIFNMYQMQLETLIEDNQINVMSNFEFVCGKLYTIKTKNNIESLDVVLCVNCKDYIIDAKTNKVISGNKRAKLTYIYELTLLRDFNAKKEINCPSCGALVKQQMSATCSHCNSSLILTSSILTMSNKRILHQFKS